jgi:hypothetical protein
MGAIAMLAPILLAASLQTIRVDAAANRHPISSGIYGGSFAAGGQQPGPGTTLTRWGGNATTRYNWQANASSRAADWYFESISEQGVAPSAGVDLFIGLSRYLGSEPMITLPTIGWAAKLGPNREKLASYSVAKYGPQQATDPFMPDAGNGVRLDGSRITNNDPNDANMPVDSTFYLDWLRHVSTLGVRYIILDNEPSLWQETHRDVHPVGPTMDEVVTNDIEAAQRVKSVDPSMLVAAPEEWGWPGYFYSGYDQQWSAAHDFSSFPDRDAHGGWDSIPWLLDQFKKAEERSGRRLLDILTVHFYPQGGEVSEDVTPEMQARRNRSTRALWDPSYHDETWIDANVELIPRLREWVNTYYPGTRIGITEYNWGAESHMNGGTTQADILGIFGREGLDLATRWTSPPPGPVLSAFNIYRNYDGHGAKFGDVSVAAEAPNPDDLSAFAALRTSDGKLTVMIVNKVPSATTASVSLANFAAGPQAEVWQLAGATSGIRRLTDLTAGGSALSIDLPAQSVTLLVIPPASSPAQPRRRAVGH